MGGRQVRRQAPILGVSLLVVVVSSALTAQQIPNAAVGFKPGGVYDLGQFDDVSAYSGSLQARLGLGPAFPRGAGRTTQLQLSYLSSAWVHWVHKEHPCDEPGFDIPTCSSEFQPKPHARAGLGWMVSLGELLAPNDPLHNNWNPERSFLWISSDGAEHSFTHKLHDSDAEDAGDSGNSQAVFYARDGSYARLRIVSPNVDVAVDTQDGDVHLFHNFGTTDVPDYRLRTITDPFGNVLAVTYENESSGIPSVRAAYTWATISDGFRTHRIEYTLTPGYETQTRVVSKVRLACFGCASGEYADYTFNYTVEDVQPPWPNSYQRFPGPRQVWMLSSVQMPDGSSIGFGYRPPGWQGIGPIGLLHRIDLPTGGAVEWTWEMFDFPAILAERVVDTEPGEVEIFQATYGVVERRVFDGSPSPATWTWEREHDGSISQLAEKLTVTSISPLGDKRIDYFSVYPVATAGYDLPRWGTSVLEFAMPYTRDPATEDVVVGDAVQRYLSSHQFDCDPGGINCNLVRTVYVAYDYDGASSSLGPGASRFNTNRRLVSERTVFHDSTVGDHWKLRSWSDFDGLGHYRVVTTAGNFDAGNVRTVSTNFNPASLTYPGSFVQIPASSPWILGTYESEKTEEDQDGNGSATGNEISLRQFSFDPNTGFLNCERILKSGDTPGPNDVLVRYAPGTEDGELEGTEHLRNLGSVVQELFHGGDKQAISTASGCSPGTTAQYTIDHAYESGARRSSKYAAVAWKFLDLDIDGKTGLPSASRDPAGVATTYTFDKQARLLTAKPQGGAGTAKDAWTRYIYTSGASSSVDIDRCKASATGCTGSDRIYRETTRFDALGRIKEESRDLPGGGVNLRKTTYDAVGNRASVSSWMPSGSGPFPATTFGGFDPFGRPASVTAPDSKQTTFLYRGVRRTETTQKIALALGGGETNVTRRETYDGQSRLFRVEELSNPAAPSTYVKTDYEYDEAGRLRRVCQDASGSTCGQERIFSYDNRGFLTSEKHPEKGASGGGLVNYFCYDSRGHAGRREDGASANALAFSFDGAERLTSVIAPSNSQCNNPPGTVLKQFVYDGAVGAGTGKLEQATRRNDLPAPWSSNYQVTETYEYQGRMGRPSKRTTALSIGGVAADTWSFSAGYDELGHVDSLTYPSCSGANCSPGSAAPARIITFGRAKGFVTSIPGWASSISYHPNLQVASVTHGNGMVETIANDPNGIARPASITADALDEPSAFATGIYAYDGAGNIKSMGSDQFKYDKVSRLVDSSLGSIARSQSYTFDKFGNLTSKTTDGGTAVSIPPSTSTNRLTGAVTYDARGNLTSWNGQTYAFDLFNMMARRDSGTETWDYIYTADDERLLALKSDQSREIWTVRDFGNRVLRRDDANFAPEPTPPCSPNACPGPGGIFCDGFESTDTCAWSSDSIGPQFFVADYVYRDDKLLATEDGSNGTQHFALDHLGTIRLITNDIGWVHSSHTYFPFGEEATPLGQDSQVMKFTSHERDLLSTPTDASDDLDYMHARFCSPLTSRFLSLDTVSGAAWQPLSWNRYSLALGNPVRLTDPDGRDERPAVSASEVVNDPVGAILKLTSSISRSQILLIDKDELGRARFSTGDFQRAAEAVEVARGFSDLFKSGEDTPNSSIVRKEGSADDALKEFAGAVEGPVRQTDDGALIGASSEDADKTLVLRGYSTDPGAVATIEEQRKTPSDKTRTRKIRYEFRPPVQERQDGN